MRELITLFCRLIKLSIFSKAELQAKLSFVALQNFMSQSGGFPLGKRPIRLSVPNYGCGEAALWYYEE